MKLKEYAILLIIMFTVVTTVFYNKSIINTQACRINALCQTTLSSMEGVEPKTPRDIDDPPWDREVFPTKSYTVPEVIEKGSEIPLDFAYSNLNWKRQAYKSYWHSSVSGGRWSYVPARIHFAMHKLFTTYPTASVYYDFIHDLGIAEENVQFMKKSDGPFDYINTVVMQAQVRKIITYGNQVVIIAKPCRSGLQVLDIPVCKIKPANIKEKLLFQLATELGDEIDYSLIDYIAPKHN